MQGRSYQTENKNDLNVWCLKLIYTTPEILAPTSQMNTAISNHLTPSGAKTSLDTEDYKNA